MDQACLNKYPKEWSNIEDHLSQKTDFSVVLMDLNSPDYQKVAAQFRQTMPQANIRSIQRIQNSWLWNRLNSKADLIIKKMNQQQGNQQRNLLLEDVSMLLFHGTSGTEPEKIYLSEEGFDMRFSKQGFWGQANYFAVNSSYSNSFAYQPQNGLRRKRQMFLARVIVGQSITLPQDNTLRMPPLIPGETTKRYDSVKGNTGGSDVYMFYSNENCYPNYLITYSLV
ncbi:hypothetical protein FGO68_gene14987 [Halteria grandinella]|uniref:Poly [ADP-ribose] polymerase n=1 Tax=Halteria grandinella TaxID=5974 RepID=A0A8J8T843_HALGN|nr:hypothetical protein FGO68_gene14987 [Halteria grandinella]